MKKIKYNTNTFLFIGLIGATLSTIGDFLLSFNQYPNADNVFVALLLSCENLSFTRLALSIFFGGICIPLQYFGLKAITQIIKNQNQEKQNYYNIINFGSIMTGLFGGVVHILCVLLMLIIKFEYLNGFTPSSTFILGWFPNSAITFTIFAIIPFCILCMLPYFLSLIFIFVSTLKGYTNFPKWFCLFNPLIIILILQTIAIIFVPNNALFNGLNMANKAIGAFLTFLTVLIWQKKNKINLEL